jgi:hypothetical protein
MNSDLYRNPIIYYPKTELLNFVEKPKPVEEKKEASIKIEEEKPKQPKENVPKGMRTVGGGTENIKQEFEKKVGPVFPVSINQEPKKLESVGESKNIFSGLNKLKDNINEIKSGTTGSLFPNPVPGIFQPKQEVKQIEKIEIKPTISISQPSQILTKPIQQELPKKQEEVIKPPQPTQPEPVEIKKKTFKDNLLEAANTYYEKRSLRISISNNPTNKKMRDKIMIEIINPTIDQLVGEEVLQEKVKSIQNLLQELYEGRLFEMYDFTLNYLCQKILNKSENYLKDRKLLSVLSKFVFQIKSKHKLLEDFFFMILAYKCPYIIPKVFTKKDFPEKEVYMKRLGYSDPDEPITTWINNIECYCYLFFGFLSLDDKYISIVKEYLNSMENITVDYPISTAFKSFLNVMGAKVKAKLPDGINVLKKTVKRYIDDLEKLKSTTKSSELKSITSDNIHFIKKYFQNVNTGNSTDYYSK